MKMVRTSRTKTSKIKCRCSKSRVKSKVKTKLWKGKVNRMSVAIENHASIAPIAIIKQKSTSFFEMIFDSKKRQETYDYNDQNYEETEDEKEIFRIMSSRRRNR